MTSLSTLDIHYFGKYVNIDFKIRLIKNIYFQHLTFIESNEFSIKWILSRTQLVWSCFIGHSLNVNSRYISKMPCPAYQDQPKVTAFLLLLLESLIEVKRAFEKTLILEKFSLICKIICTQSSVGLVLFRGKFTYKLKHFRQNTHLCSSRHHDTSNCKNYQ